MKINACKHINVVTHSATYTQKGSKRTLCVATIDAVSINDSFKTITSPPCPQSQEYRGSLMDFCKPSNVGFMYVSTVFGLSKTYIK